MNAQSLIAKYAPKQPTFDIELMSIDEAGQPSIDTLVVKQLRSTEEMTALKVKAMQFARMLQTNPPTPYKPFLPVSEHTGEMVLVVSELVVEPPVLATRRAGDGKRRGAAPRPHLRADQRAQRHGGGRGRCGGH